MSTTQPDNVTSTPHPPSSLPNDEGSKDEYLEHSQNIRHWGNLRFASLTVMLALNAGLATILLPTDRTSTIGSLHPFRGLFGVVATIIFLILDERIVVYWLLHVKRAAELENDLKYNQYKQYLKKRKEEPAKYINSQNAIRTLYGLLSAFWLVILSSDLLLWLLVVLIFVLLVGLALCCLSSNMDSQTSSKRLHTN